MMGPSELLRRAAQNRRRRSDQPAREEPLLPRPVMVQSHHANYTALMHNHDRVRTRHLSGQGKERRA